MKYQLISEGKKNLEVCLYYRLKSIKFCFKNKKNYDLIFCFIILLGNADF